jgi:alpha-ribazole phosphatase
MRLYLVRHPEPAVKSDTCYGSSDVEVLPAQQERIRNVLLGMLPKDAVLYSSPLRRCADLARTLAPALNCRNVIFDPRLAEMHFGDWESRPWIEIPRPEVEAWVKDTVGYRPGGGESVLQIAERVKAFHDELLQQQHQSAAIICHAGTIRMLLGCQRDLPLPEMARYAAQVRHKIGYGEVVLLDM